MTDGQDPDKLTVKDALGLGTQMVLNVIPLVGPLIEKATFGPLQERRIKRVERTLREFAAKLHEANRHFVDDERFLGLLEQQIPRIADATDEVRREWLRDLLLGAATHDPSADDWGEAELSARLIAEIDGPGLALLAAVGNFGTELVTLWSSPAPAVYAGENEFDRVGGPPPDLARVPLPYSWVVLQTWISRLSVGAGNGLLNGRWFRGTEGRSPHGVGTCFGASLRGRMVINWALRT